MAPGYADERHVALVARRTSRVAAFAPTVEERFELALAIGAAEREGVLGPDDEGRPLAPAARNADCSRSSSDDDIAM